MFQRPNNGQLLKMDARNLENSFRRTNSLPILATGKQSAENCEKTAEDFKDFQDPSSFTVQLMKIFSLFSTSKKLL